MSRYINADKAIEIWKDQDYIKLSSQETKARIMLDAVPSADVVEVGIITCFGIKFVVEDDIIKVKWRHGDKHYIVPFGGLLELWEKYEEQEHDT